jgi:hypothetical protein
MEISFVAGFGPITRDAGQAWLELDLVSVEAVVAGVAELTAKGRRLLRAAARGNRGVRRPRGCSAPRVCSSA